MSAPPARTALADTYPNPSNAVFRTGIGALYDYVKGLLGATGNGAEAREALGLGSAGAVSLRNLVNNRTLTVNQRAKAGTVVLAAGVYGHDQWKAGAGGCTYTFAASGNDVVITISAGSLVHVIEGTNIVGGTYAASWSGTSTAKLNGGTAAASGVTAAGVTAGSNLPIEMGVGTFTRVQVEQGATVTTFERRSIADEIKACQRYYETGGGELQAYNSTGNGTGVRVPFKVTKRATPTLTYTVSASTNCATFDARSATPDGLTWFATPVATGTIAWIGGWTASSEL